MVSWRQRRRCRAAARPPPRDRERRQGSSSLGRRVSGATLSGGTLEIESGGAAPSSTITFAGSGSLVLYDTKFRGKIAGFDLPAETIDLTTVSFASATLGYTGNALSGTLTVTDGTHTARLAMLGSYVAANFHLAATAMAARLSSIRRSRAGRQSRRRIDRLQGTDREHADHEFLLPQLNPHDLWRLARPPLGPLLHARLMACLDGLVDHVVLLRAEKEMIGVDAGAHIAAMADDKPFGIGPCRAAQAARCASQWLP